MAQILGLFDAYTLGTKAEFRAKLAHLDPQTLDFLRAITAAISDEAFARMETGSK